MLDPITLSASFATIVGLISNFKSERNASSENEYNEFIAWLAEKRHNTVIDEINSNHLLSLSIKSTLNQNHEELILKLKGLDNSIATLATKISGFNEIAHAINPNIEFSEQAISFIKQLDESQGSYFLELPSHDGPTYATQGGNAGNISFTESRFVDDDLETLCKYGLLISDCTSQGYRSWKITRQAVGFLELTKNEL